MQRRTTCLVATEALSQTLLWAPDVARRPCRRALALPAAWTPLFCRHLNIVYFCSRRPAHFLAATPLAGSLDPAASPATCRLPARSIQLQTALSGSWGGFEQRCGGQLNSGGGSSKAWPSVAACGCPCSCAGGSCGGTAGALPGAHRAPSAEGAGGGQRRAVAALPAQLQRLQPLAQLRLCALCTINGWRSFSLGAVPRAQRTSGSKTWGLRRKAKQLSWAKQHPGTQLDSECQRASCTRAPCSSAPHVLSDKGAATGERSFASVQGPVLAAAAP